MAHELKLRMLGLAVDLILAVGLSLHMCCAIDACLAQLT